jgi:hypothetical protein
MLDSTAYPHVDDNMLALLGNSEAAGLYLGRCQVDTPHLLVRQVWQLVNDRRPNAGRVVDFGSGDARFAQAGMYTSYTGFEIDRSRYANVRIPVNAKIINACAFSKDIQGVSCCIGNPPYVRNQDLPIGWRQSAAEVIERRTGVQISGLANAWQYFFLLALASTGADGLVAIIVPFEWVSRPSSAALRDFIKSEGWGVSVYRLGDSTFESVMTTASITIVDKREKNGRWRYYREDENGLFRPMKSPTGGRRAVLPYITRNTEGTHAKRGLSPGTQDYLVLTESERARCGLRPGSDVVRCVTSLRPTSGDALAFTEHVFMRDYVRAGRKCWLVRTDKAPSPRLKAYLDSVPKEARQSSTCRSREIWWKFTMPAPPEALMATGFKKYPKVVVNQAGVVAVGSVCGIYAPSRAAGERAVRLLRNLDYSGCVVPHANGLLKLEINQINSMLASEHGH